MSATTLGDLFPEMRQAVTSHHVTPENRVNPLR
jgi:hypothetical protein